MKKVMTISQTGTLIYPQVEVASNFRRRFLGLMGRRNLDEGTGLLLTHCSSIHTCFMCFPIDVVYLDRNFKVLEYETVRPWRLGSLIKGTCHILELPACAADQLRRGQLIALQMITDSRKGNRDADR